MEIPIYTKNVPFLTTEQMNEVDRAMIHDYKIELIQMMENAGRNLAHLARIRFFAGHPAKKKVVVLAGIGGNGGGALVCARHLHNWGAQVWVYVTQPDSRFSPIPRHQLDILHHMRIPVAQAASVTVVKSTDLIIDGVIGYRLNGAPNGPAGELIRWANAQNAPILSLDVPSGVDTTTGTIYAPAVCATATMTLALPKKGFFVEGVEKQVGELYLADIGVPPMVFENLGLSVHVGNLFSESEIIRLF